MFSLIKILSSLPGSAFLGLSVRVYRDGVQQTPALETITPITKFSATYRATYPQYLFDSQEPTHFFSDTKLKASQVMTLSLSQTVSKHHAQTANVRVDNITNILFGLAYLMKKMLSIRNDII